MIMMNIQILFLNKNDLFWGVNWGVLGVLHAMGGIWGG